MARKAKGVPKPSKLRGFGLGGERTLGSERMGFVGEMDDGAGASAPESTFWEGLTQPAADALAPREPLLRMANVATLGGGLALHLLGVKSVWTAALAANLTDVLARQVSTRYRSEVGSLFGAWNKGVLWMPR